MTSPRAQSQWSLTGHSVRERALLTLVSLGVMGAMFWTYSLVVKPLIKSPRMSDWKHKVDFDIPKENASPARAMADQFLAHVPWVKEATYASTPNGYIYYQTWTPDEDDKKTIHFTPFAMIWLQKGRKDEEPPYTVASESAFITFEQEMDFDNGKVFLRTPGRPEGGGLEREVVITGPNGIQAKSRNIVFDAKAYRIWTADHIDFVFNNRNSGSSLGMQVDLIPGPKSSEADRLDIAGIKSVRLLRSVTLNLEEERRDKKQLAAGGGPAPKPKKPKPPEKVQISSDGSLEFVPNTNTVTLIDNVRILRPTELGKTDSLVTDNTGTVEMKFEEKPESPKKQQPPVEGSPQPLASSTANGSVVTTVSATVDDPSPGAQATQAEVKDEPFRGLNSKLSFRKMHARGKSVTLVSQSNNLSARGATSIQYDAVERTASLSSAAKSPNGTTLPVLVRQKTSVMTCPEITLVQDEKSNITRVWCRGQGKLDSYDEKTGEIHELSAEWLKELRKFPDPQSEFDIIELDEQALVRQPQQHSGLVAEHIRIWTDPTRRTKDQAKNALSPGGAKTRSSSVRPRCMLAWQNVAFVNPDMQVRTDRLEVYFQDRPTTGAAAVGAFQPTQVRPLQLTSNRQPTRLFVERRQGMGRGIHHLDPAHAETDRPKRRIGISNSVDHPQAFASTADERSDLVSAELAGQQVSLPENNASSSVTDSLEIAPGSGTTRQPGQKEAAAKKQMLKQPEDEPYDVEAEVVKVLVLQGTDRADTEVARIQTVGNVKVQQRHASGEDPLQIAGDEVHVENRSKSDSAMHVVGRPAHVRDRGLYIEGNDIYFDRAGNQARVEGVGRLQLPISQSVDGKPMKTPVPLDIFWKERMTFDGLTAHFIEGVQSKMDDERTKSEMRCNEMQVVLTDRLDFSGKDSREKVKVRIIRCKGGVDVESDEFEKGRRVEIRRVHAPEFDLDQTTGDTHAQGPGIIRRWQFGQGNTAGLGPTRTVRANSAIKPSASEWTYTQVDFDGHMSGNMNQRMSKFHDNVRVLYGSVANETSVVDRDKLGEDAGWMGCDTLTITQHPEADMQPAYAVLEADGNARLEGRTYYGQADNISYDGSKGNILLLGHSNGAATLWRQTVRGGGYERQNGQRFEFYPRINKLIMHQVESLNGVQ